MISVFNVFLRYLVPRDLSVGHFIHILSSRLSLPPGKALFVFVKNTLPQTCKPAPNYSILLLLLGRWNFLCLWLLQLVWWTLSTDHSRMRMDIFTCIIAPKKPLVRT